MRRFVYRAARYTVDFPVFLHLGDLVLTGRCKEMSAEGMRVDFDEIPPQNSLGTVNFQYDDLVLDLPVRVAHSASISGGLKFLYKSKQQRDLVTHMVSRLAAPQRCDGLFLVHVPKQLTIC